jgi:hypothetical protein
MEYDMLEKLFKFLKDHVEYAPEPPSAQTAPASP